LLRRRGFGFVVDGTDHGSRDDRRGRGAAVDGDHPGHRRAHDDARHRGDDARHGGADGDHRGLRLLADITRTSYGVAHIVADDWGSRG
jgi:hypothetical protein